MEKYYFDFRIIVFSDGSHRFSSIVHPPNWDMLNGILGMFFSISELNWFKLEVIKARNKGVKTYTGQNTFYCYVNDMNCELYNEFHKDNIQNIPTDVVLEYIDKCIRFIESYESGKISSIVPVSRKDDWLIVPKEYVDEKFSGMINRKN